MAKHPTRPRDTNQLARLIVDIATGEAPEPSDTNRPVESEAAERGRLGGLRGGKARAAKLTAEERTEAARRASAKRWGKTKG